MSLLGRSVELPALRKEPVTAQFAECVELRPEIDEPMERLLDYWKCRLSDVPTLELPTDRPRLAVPSFRGAIQRFTLSPDLVAGLKDLGRKENATLFMTLAAAFQVLLQRYSGQDDIVIGTSTTSSSHKTNGSLRHSSLNTLALRTDFSRDSGFRELLVQVRKVTLGAYAHQDLLFEKLVEALNLPQEFSRNPLFQVMFIVRNIGDGKLQLNEIAPELLKDFIETAQFDLTLDLSETLHGLEGELRYATDLFEAEAIAQLTCHFQTLLEGIVARPEARLSELTLLTETEHRQLLVEWNDTRADYPKDKCTHQLFEKQVARTPDATALVFEGEALNNSLLQSLFAKLDITVCNLYGPTEACIDATYWRCNKNFNSPVVPIGRLVHNTEIYILDHHLQPVPIDMTGEIHIGVDGLARGYLNCPELSAEKFISHPFNKDRQARLYKTDDLDRYLPDGTIEFLGPIDHQVKIRGFRIELGEIESVLKRHPQLHDVVRIYEHSPENKRLVAYLVTHGDETPTASELQNFLKPQLPEFMIPTAFVFLDELPLTPNGKLDRKALPKPDMNRQELDVDFVAPRNQVEQQLAEIWCDILRINHVGIHDNFFELGGQPLLATQLIIRISGQLSVEIPLASLFEMPTIAELAKLIENNRASTPNDSSRIIPQRRSAYKKGNS
jgi:acyl carrier protein